MFLFNRIFENKVIKAFRLYRESLYRQSAYGRFDMSKKAIEQGGRASSTLHYKVLPTLSELEMREYTRMTKVFNGLLDEAIDAQDELALARLFATPVSVFSRR